MWKRIEKYLSLPWVSVICFILAVAGKIAMIRIFLGMGPDKFAQTSMAHNLLHGHGLTLNQAPMGDLSKIIYLPDNGWPPGYSLLLSLFLPFTGDHYATACFLVDCLSVLLFFNYCRKLLLLIKFPVWITNLFLLYQGFIIVRNGGGTDYLSLTFLTASLYYLVKIIESDVVSLKRVLLLAFFLVLASFIRYQNMPVSICVAGSLMAIGWVQKKRGWRISGIIVLSCLILLCGGFLWYQYLHTGSAYYLVPVKKGIFPANLVYMNPFLVGGMANIHFYAVQLSSIFSNGYHFWLTAANWIGLPVTITVTGIFTFYAIKKNARICNTMDGFFILGFIIYMATIGLLVFLALTHDKNIGPPLFTWTYVMDARYYIFPVFFASVCLWWYFFVRPPANNNLLIRLLKAGFILLMTIETIHGMYFAAKKSSLGLISLQAVPYDLPQQAFAIRFIKTMQQQDPDRKVVVTGFDKRYDYLTSLYGASGLFTPLLLNEKLPTSSKPAVLLVVIRENELFLMDTFLKQPGVKLLSQIKDFSFYTYYVEPSPGNLP